MFGYVRPSNDRLTEEERQTFQAAYCGLCHTLGKRYGAAGRMQVITVGPVTQGDADAVLEVCRARGLVDAGLYRSEWRDA
mgnify:CR=1 FL=1